MLRQRKSHKSGKVMKILRCPSSSREIPKSLSSESSLLRFSYWKRPIAMFNLKTNLKLQKNSELNSMHRIVFLHCQNVMENFWNLNSFVVHYNECWPQNSTKFSPYLLLENPFYFRLAWYLSTDFSDLNWSSFDFLQQLPEN